MKNTDIARKLGRQGGLTTSKKYGKEHYQKLAQKMNEKLKEKRLASKGDVLTP